MNMISFLTAAASKVVSAEELADISEFYGFSGDLSSENADKILMSEEISQKQAVLVYGYCYLYCRLSMTDTAKLNDLRKILKLPFSVHNNCIRMITERKINFILDDLIRHGSPAHAVFKENEEYVVYMLSELAAEPLISDKKIFTDLSSSEYEHPTDRSYLDNLNANKTIEKIAKLYSEYRFERLVTVQYTGSNICVNEKNIPYLYNALKTVCEVLDVKEIPQLYVAPGSLNACTIGSSKPIIVISGICLSLLTYDELLFILGHEVGHIKSQHVLYHSLGNFIPYLANIIGNLTLGIGEIAVKAVVLLLFQWYRMSEFTADRAGLLACQNIDAAVTVMAKLAGYPPSHYDDIDTESFLRQASEFEDLDSNMFDRLMKFFSGLYKSHPWTVMRAKELKNWYDTGSYSRIYNVSQRVKEERKSSNIINSIFQKDIYCAHCGKLIPESSRFCEFCGKENMYRK